MLFVLNYENRTYIVLGKFPHVGIFKVFPALSKVLRLHPPQRDLLYFIEPIEFRTLFHITIPTPAKHTHSKTHRHTPLPPKPFVI